MRVLLVIVCLAACGGPQSNQSIDTREKFVAWHQNHMKVQKSGCDRGDRDACVDYGMDLIYRFTLPKHPDWIDDTYPLDLAKGKAILFPLCTSEVALTSVGACARLVSTVPLSVDELDKLCLFQDCAVAGHVAKLDDKGLHDLCVGNNRACIPVLARVQDAQLKSDVAPLAELGEILDIVKRRAEEAKYAAQRAADDDDDDAPSGGDDNKCHKDTDCKGDRICDKGSCVDSKAAAAAKPPAPTRPAVAFKNDRCSDLSKELSERVLECPALEKDADAIHDHLVKAAQLEASAAHQADVFVGCGQAKVALYVAMSDLHCAK